MTKAISILGVAKKIYSRLSSKHETAEVKSPILIDMFQLNQLIDEYQFFKNTKKLEATATKNLQAYIDYVKDEYGF